MEAARRLTLRGHTVTLLEASSQLGGTARIAAIAYAPNGDFIEWLKHQLGDLKVDVRLNSKASAGDIEALAPDVVIVATGAIRRSPEIPGKDQAHVHDAASLRALLLGEDEEGATAKASLTQDVCFYEADMDQAVRARRRVTQALREALEREQFELHYQEVYQPKYLRGNNE